MNRKLTPFWTLFILTGLNLFNYFDRYVLSAVLPSVQRTLDLNDSQGGWLGITDKYWMAAVIPDQSTAINGTFQHILENNADRYQSSFIQSIQYLSRMSATTKCCIHINSIRVNI